MALVLEVKPLSESVDSAWRDAHLLIDEDHSFRDKLSTGDVTTRVRYRVGKRTPFGVLLSYAGWYGVRLCTEPRRGIRAVFAIYCKAFAPVLIGCAFVGAVSALCDEILLFVISLGIFMFVSSLIMHELGHLIAFAVVARSRLPEARIVTRFLMMSLVRPPLKRWQEIVVISAGPLAPAFALPLLFPFLFFAPAVFWLWGAFVVGSILMLFVPVGDGANLRML